MTLKYKCRKQWRFKEESGITLGVASKLFKSCSLSSSSPSLLLLQTFQRMKQDFKTMGNVCNLLPVRGSNGLQQAQCFELEETHVPVQILPLYYRIQHVKSKRVVFPSWRAVQVGFQRSFQALKALDLPPKWGQKDSCVSAHLPALPLKVLLQPRSPE